MDAPFFSARLLPRCEWAILPFLPPEAVMAITAVGLDLAKNVFQVHGVDVALRRLQGFGPGV